jgi:hypothetical protein
MNFLSIRHRLFGTPHIRVRKISQLDLPIVGEGKIDIGIEGEVKTIGITRAHLAQSLFPIPYLIPN